MNIPCNSKKPSGEKDGFGFKLVVKGGFEGLSPKRVSGQKIHLRAVN